MGAGLCEDCEDFRGLSTSHQPHPNPNLERLQVRTVTLLHPRTRFGGELHTIGCEEGAFEFCLQTFLKSLFVDEL